MLVGLYVTHADALADAMLEVRWRETGGKPQHYALPLPAQR